MLLKSEAPTISVIIPTHNRSALLMRAVKSVIAQEYLDWELLIIDDGSTDETAKRLSSLINERIRYFLKNHNERSSARNYGIEKARGKYICFLDDDDYFLSDHLLNFYDKLKALNFPDLILRTGFLINEGFSMKKTTNYKKGYYKNPVHFFAKNMCGVGSLLIPKIFLSSDKFPEQFIHWQDTHLFLRLLAKHPFEQLDCHTYVYVIHEGMGSKSLLTKKNVISRMENNLQAIEHLFNNYSATLFPFLPNKTKSYLIAEKRLQQAILLVKINLDSDGLKKFRASLADMIHWKFISLYLQFIYNFFKAKLR